MAPSNCAVFLRSGARCGSPYRWASGPPVTRKAQRDLHGDRRWSQATCKRQRIRDTDGRTHYRRIKKLRNQMKRLFAVMSADEIVERLSAHPSGDILRISRIIPWTLRL